MTGLATFLSRHDAIVRVALTSVRGSSPREAGTVMLAAARAQWGTIGGGQLEYLALDQARKMLRNGETTATLDVPLGPDIGQCCGGRVEIALATMDATARATALAADAADRAAYPHVYLFGAGHVGRALAGLFAQLPVRCILVDSRTEELVQCAAHIEKRLSALPEADIETAPAGSAFIVLTHDHALDFLLTSAALARQDAAYVGMIGSATKRAKFTAWAKDNGPDDISNLICPIGGPTGTDKRPAVIAAFVVAEVMAALTKAEVRETPALATSGPNGSTGTGGTT